VPAPFLKSDMEFSNDEAQILAILAAAAQRGGVTLSDVERASERHWMFKGDYDKSASSFWIVGSSSGAPIASS